MLKIFITLGFIILQDCSNLLRTGVNYLSISVMYLLLFCPMEGKGAPYVVLILVAVPKHVGTFEENVGPRVGIVLHIT